MYNEEVDALAKAGAALSKLHRPGRVRDMLQGKSTDRLQGNQEAAAMQVSDNSTDSDRPAHIRHRRREMRNAPLDIPHPEPD